MKHLLLESGVALARMLREGEISSLELVETHIAHITQVNGTINAMVAERFAEARKEAKEADRRLQQEDPASLPPFLGVPCSIKECFALKGMPNTSGLISRRHVISTKDASAVRRLREAGAIPLGVTNTSELCMWMESFNPVYGRTDNPYDPSRIVGGSSGGEGAIIAAGGTPFGLGSDIGGSIRMPAFFNGVFGHKPSSGLIPNTGQFPVAEGRAGAFLGTGPLTRRAEDLMPLLRVMAGPDDEDPICRTMPLGEPASVDLGTLKVLSVMGDDKDIIAADLLIAQAEVARHLRTLGASVQRKTFDKLRYSSEIWASSLGDAEERNKIRRYMGRERKRELLAQLLRLPLGIAHHSLPLIVMSLLENISDLQPQLTEKMVAFGQDLRQEIIDALGPNGVMLYPSYISVAPRHYQPMRQPLKLKTPIFNILALPVTQVPLGLNEEGLPLGVQVIGAPGQDHVTIAVALELEKAFGGWVPPPLWFAPPAHHTAPQNRSIPAPTPL